MRLEQYESYLSYIFVSSPHVKDSIKLCSSFQLKVASEMLAMHFMLQELEKSDSAALRNNLVVMMADFCIRYTALVDW
jgi:hypothetical protein